MSERWIYVMFYWLTALIIALPIVVFIVSGILMCLAMIFIELVIGILIFGYILQTICSSKY